MIKAVRLLLLSVAALVVYMVVTAIQMNGEEKKPEPPKIADAQRASYWQLAADLATTQSTLQQAQSQMEKLNAQAQTILNEMRSVCEKGGAELGQGQDRQPTCIVKPAAVGGTPSSPNPAHPEPNKARPEVAKK